MSVVRLLSTVLAIFVTFLWAGFVVNAWQKNTMARQLAQTSSDKSSAEKIARDQSQEKTDTSKKAVAVATVKKKTVAEVKKTGAQAAKAKLDPTLDKADELARAANEEFSKRIKLAEAKILKPSSKEVKEVVGDKTAPEKKAIVPETISVSKATGVSKLASVTEKTKLDSENHESVVSKDGTVTKVTFQGDVKKDAVDASLTQEQTNDNKNQKAETKIDDLASSKDQTRISTDKETARISDEAGRDKFAPIEMAQERIAIASTKKEVMNDVVDERALLKEDRIESKIETRLSFNTTSDDNSSAIDHDVARGGKDNSRLSKDRVVVAVNKHQPKELKLAENKAVIKSPAKQDETSAVKKVTPAKKPEPVTKKVATAKVKSKVENKDVVKAKPIWTVPTGVTPEYSVVEKIERGLDSVAEAAVEAGNKLSEKVTSLGDNVKGAIAAPKKWEVPTGVTPGGDDPANSIKVAETPSVKKSASKAKDVKELKKRTPDAVKSKVAVVAPPKLKKEKKVASKKETDNKRQENKVYVSSQLDDYSGAKIYDDAGKLIVAETAKEEKSSKTGGLMKTIINLLTDPKKEVAGKGNKQKETELVSRVDKVRFEAIKNLMVEDVDYKFINAKKGQGQIVVTGRSQAEAKLSLYVGVRYLGDVIADNSGNWIFTKELYIPQGPHILQAQQMSKSGIAMARKTLPFKQTKKGKAPEGYDKDGIGIELGDKALATLRSKLKKDKQAGKDGKTLTKDETKLLKRNQALAARTPLPVRKIGEKKLASAKKDKEVKVAALDKKVDVKTSLKKKDKKSVSDNSSEKGKIKAVSKEQLSNDKSASDKNPAPKYYVVKRGDSLGRIAKRELGSTSAYKTILKLNKKLKSANLIYPGQKLLISAGSNVAVAAPVKEKKKQVASLALPKVKSKKAKAIEKKTDATPSHYVVKRGDSLWKIASKVYGNGRRYKELIKLNPKILKNPASIKPNVKLRVKSS
jgi:nucleoid-associated protein YgaU